MSPTPRPTHRGLLPLLLLSTLALPAAAQETEAPRGQFGERIEVRVVDVDVVVTDRDGNPILGLRREDFKLYEDGREVEIRYFTPVVGGFVVDSAAPATPAEGAAAPPAEAAPPPALPQRPAPLTWAIFMDHTLLRPGPRNDALRQLRDFLERNLRPGDPVAIATFDNGKFRVRRELTTDHKLVLRELAEIQKESFDANPIPRQEMALRTELQQVSDPLTEGMRIAAEIDLLVQIEAERTRHAIAALDTYLDVLSGQEGRFAVVYLGGGFNTLPAMGITDEWRKRFPQLVGNPGTPRPEDYQIELQSRLAKLYERVSAGRAAFYAIDVADPGSAMLGPEDPGSLDVQVGAVGDAGRPQAEGTVRQLAQRTGGQYFRRNPRLAEQLRTVAEDLGYYYSLGYEPKGPPGEHRTLRVEVVVPGARVRHRQAVRERTPEEQAEDAVVTALFSDSRPNPLGVQLETGTVERLPRGRGKVVPTRVLVPLRELTLVPEGEVHRGELVFHFALGQPDGTIWRVEEKRLPISVPAADLPGALAQHVSYGISVPVVGDEVELSVAVQDVVSGTRSVLTVPLSGRRR